MIPRQKKAQRAATDGQRFQLGTARPVDRRKFRSVCRFQDDADIHILFRDRVIDSLAADLGDLDIDIGKRVHIAVG